MRRTVFPILISLSVILSACGGNTSGESLPGEEIFYSGGSTLLGCSTCHSLDGTDNVGPSLMGISDRAGDRVNGLSAEDYIRNSIIAPSAYLVAGYNDSMPTLYAEQLTQEEIDDLVKFLLTQ